MAKIVCIKTGWAPSAGWYYAVIETDYADPVNQVEKTLACGGYWNSQRLAEHNGEIAKNRIQLGVGPESPLYRELVNLANARDERNAAFAEDELIAGDRELSAEKIERSDRRALELQMRHPAGSWL